MRNLLFLIAAALGALLPSCTPANRVVENPLIETANTRTLDIVKVELSDTATVLHMNAYYRPKNWIVISSDSYLQIPARRFMLTGAEGITPDSLFWMPKSGRASFVLRFPPLPRGTKSFDFIESDCDDCFKIYGVDLTGKTEYPEYPEGLPKELRKAPKDGPVPDPILAVGETTVNIHLLGFREGMYKDMTLYINSMLTGHERKDAPIDPETGVATFKFGQYGPSLIYGNPAGPGSMHLNFWTAPGETADIYVDLTEKGKSIVQRRGKERKASHDRKLYATGTYADLNMLYDMRAEKQIGFDFYTGKFADYRMTADEYAQDRIQIQNADRQRRPQRHVGDDEGTEPALAQAGGSLCHSNVQQSSRTQLPLGKQSLGPQCKDRLQICHTGAETLCRCLRIVRHQ